MNRISKYTRSHIRDLFINGIEKDYLFDAITLKYKYNGQLNEVDFLNRLYKLRALPSNDPKYECAEEEIFQHTEIIKDYPKGWIFNDLRFPLKDGKDEDFLKFICEIFNPEVCIEQYKDEFIKEISKLLRNDRYEIYIKDFLSRKPIYSWREISDEEIDQFIPFSMRYKKWRDNENITLSIPKKIRREIYNVMNIFEDSLDCADETGYNECKNSFEILLEEINKYYEPHCFDEKNEYVKTENIENFILNNYPQNVFDAIELYPIVSQNQHQFAQRINNTIKDLKWRLVDGKFMPFEKETIDISLEETKDDNNLNKIIENARTFFYNNDKQTALEKTWDAFERLKTYFSANKKNSLRDIITAVAKGDTDLYNRINKEFNELTEIGNKYQIRHFEKGKIELKDENIKEYLYYRCMALINLAITTLNK